MTLEDLARTAARNRGGGRCELCGSPTGLEASHRIARSRLGTWHPANILLLDYRCHDWCHANPTLARWGGWFVDTEANPMLVPVYLRSAQLWPGWFTLDDRGDATPADPVPVLPPWCDTPSGFLT
jgi:DNA-binding transcriptional LysR family regulator